MKPRIQVVELVVVFLAFYLLSTLTQAVEIHVLSVPATRPVFNELGPQFERTTGHVLAMKYDFVPALTNEIRAGAKFDMAILEPYALDELINQGRIAASSRRNFAYVGLGVGMREGSTKPDIGSVDTFRRALLNAKSIAYQPDNSSGRYFVGLLQRLGIAAEVQSKLKPKPGGAAAPSVARGEAEFVVMSIPGLLTTPGVELIGPFPPEAQSYIRFEAGVCTCTTAEASKAAAGMLEFFASESAAPVFKARGIGQGAP